MTPAPCKIIDALSTPTITVYAPHVLGEFALHMLVELLVGVTLPVVQVSLIEFVTKILAESQELLKVIEYRSNSRIRIDFYLAHDISFFDKIMG